MLIWIFKYQSSKSILVQIENNLNETNNVFLGSILLIEFIVFLFFILLAYENLWIFAACLTLIHYDLSNLFQNTKDILKLLLIGL